MLRTVYLPVLLALLVCVEIQAQPASDDTKAQPASVSTQAATNWLSFSEALAAAKISGRPILVDVFAPWCPWCQKLQTEVYPDKDIQEYIEKNFEIARLDIEDKETTIEFRGYTLTSAELASGLGAEATPTTVFLAANGDYITRLPGFIDADEFIHVLKYIGSGAFQSQAFKEYRAGQK